MISWQIGDSHKLFILTSKVPEVLHADFDDSGVVGMIAWWELKNA